MRPSPMSRRTLLRNGLVLGGTAAVAPAFLAACGGPEPAGRPTSTAPVKGGTLRAAFPSSPADAIDPVRSSDMLGLVRGMLVYERLGAARTDGTVAPILYDELTPNADVSQWTLRLKPGVRFADGTPMTAADVLASLASFAGTEAGASVAVIDVARSTTTDERTAVLATVTPIADLDRRLANSAFLVLPGGRVPASVEELNGSGPYAVRTFAPGQRSTLVRRPEYWGGDGSWFPGTVELIAIGDPAARMNALISGQVDYAHDVSFVDARAQADNPAVVISESAAPAGLGWFMNGTIAPFDDLRVRQAFRMAVDREALTAAVLHGYGRPGNDLWGAGLPGYNSRLPQRTFDPAGARALLTQAGKDRVALTVLSSAFAPGLVESTQLMAQQVKDVGFDVTIQEVPPDAFYSDIPRWFTVSGVTFSTVYGFSDMTPLTYQAQSPFNFGWQRPDWEAAFSTAIGIPDPTGRQQAFDDLQKQLWDEGPDVVWGLAPLLVATAPGVGGVAGIPDLQQPYLAGVWTQA